MLAPISSALADVGARCWCRTLVAEPAGPDPLAVVARPRLGSDPSRSDPTRSDPSRSDPSRSDPTRSDPTGSDPTGSDPTGSDPGAASALSTTNAWSESTRPFRYDG